MTIGERHQKCEIFKMKFKMAALKGPHVRLYLPHL